MGEKSVSLKGNSSVVTINTLAGFLVETNTFSQKEIRKSSPLAHMPELVQPALIGGGERDIKEAHVEALVDQISILQLKSRNQSVEKDNLEKQVSIMNEVVCRTEMDHKKQIQILEGLAQEHQSVVRTVMQEKVILQVQVDDLKEERESLKAGIVQQRMTLEVALEQLAYFEKFLNEKGPISLVENDSQQKSKDIVLNAKLVPARDGPFSEDLGTISMENRKEVVSIAGECEKFLSSEGAEAGSLLTSRGHQEADSIKNRLNTQPDNESLATSTEFNSSRPTLNQEAPYHPMRPSFRVTPSNTEGREIEDGRPDVTEKTRPEQTAFLTLPISSDSFSKPANNSVDLTLSRSTSDTLGLSSSESDTFQPFLDTGSQNLQSQHEPLGANITDSKEKTLSYSKGSSGSSVSSRMSYSSSTFSCRLHIPYQPRTGRRLLTGTVFMRNIFYRWQPFYAILYQCQSCYQLRLSQSPEMMDPRIYDLVSRRSSYAVVHAKIEKSSYSHCFRVDVDNHDPKAPSIHFSVPSNADFILWCSGLEKATGKKNDGDVDGCASVVSQLSMPSIARRSNPKIPTLMAVGKQMER